MKKRFRITYDDPKTSETVTIEREFEDSATVAAREWAMDFAYTLANKGWNRVEEIPQCN